MIKKFLKIFTKSNINSPNRLQNLKNDPEIKKIFNSINEYSTESEILFVGGCVRQNILGEKIEDIDLATNLNPDEVVNCLDKNNIKHIDVGKKYGTITAIIEKEKFEITSLRKDVKTDGRFAEFQYCKDWKEDAKRRDFTFNSIYSNLNEELFDPFNGKKDLLNGWVKFIGNPATRIKEDYLRILRYIRFFLIYSKNNHSEEIKKIIKQNESGFSLVESIFVLVISSALLVIAAPKLEIPVRKSIEEIKNYSKVGFDSLRRSADVSKELRLLQEKLNIRSYLYAAKNLYMSDSIFPKSAGDLQRFTKVSGCYLTQKKITNDNLRNCRELGNNSTATSWESKNRNYWVRMYSEDLIFNVQSIPFIDDEKGVLGCFNSKTGIVATKIFKKDKVKINTFRC